jgi:hypothetical protein
MKKLTALTFILVLTVAVISGQANAGTIALEDWGFNPNGVDGSLPGLIIPIDEITYIGQTYIDQDGVGPGTTFVDSGAFSATSFQNDGAPISVATTMLGFSYEITAVIEASGVNTTLVGTDQNFVFDAGGTVSLYLDTAMDYGSSNGFYGADGGTLIASFEITSGSGDFDFNPNITDGQIDLYMKATYLKTGVWYDADGVTDLATMVDDGLVAAITDSNNDLIDPTDTQKGEWQEKWGVGGAGNNFPEDFFTQNDGSMAPSIVPEPGSIILLGLGLLGFAGLGRRKRVR